MRLILTLGMHRSGTSVVARSLQCLGVDLGGSLIGPSSDNRKGFFEDLDVVRINERVLRQVGAAWNRPPPLATDVLGEIAAGPVGNVARRTLALKATGSRPFGIKDPRLCVLLRFWRPVFERLECDVVCVIPLRHPLSVAASLQRRDGLDEVAAIDLWLRYMLGAMTEVNPFWPCVVVAYDAILARPHQELRRVACALNLTIGPQDVDDFAENFLDAKLCHHHEIHDEGRTRGGAFSLYSELLQFARKEAPMPSRDLAELTIKVQTLGAPRANIDN